MSMSIERSTVTGIFPERGQAEQAMAALKAAGFGDDVVGMAGRDEVAEGLGLREAQETTGGSEFVVVTVEAEGRMQEAHAILLQSGASEVHAAQAERASERPVEVAAQGYGLQRDATVEGNNAVAGADPDRSEEAIAEEEGDDTFFGQTTLPEGVEPGSKDDPNVHNPRPV